VSSIPGDLTYSKEHEWVAGLDEDLTVKVGVTAYAAEQLGDVVYVQLPEVGSPIEAGDPVGEIESTKSVSDVYAPVGGEVVETNQAVVDDPSLINSDPYGAAWLFRVRVEGDYEELMTPEEYATLIAGDS
jgi:glycine cleavage system H protein